MNYNYFLNIYGYEPSKGWDGYKKQLNEQGMATDFHDEFGFGYKPGSATPSPTPSEHEYVDLGLPSGTLWATEDIKEANGNCLLFAWAETKGYTVAQVGVDKDFSIEDYKYAAYDEQTDDYVMTKYNDIGSENGQYLEEEDDAAAVNWGEDWCIPTYAQCQELIDETEISFIEGSGMKCTSKTDPSKFVFFPFEYEVYDGDSGPVVTPEIEENELSRWCNTCDNYMGYAMHLFHSIDIDTQEETNEGDIGSMPRYNGITIRPVRVAQ